jgi:plasmid stability protein
MPSKNASNVAIRKRIVPTRVTVARHAFSVIAMCRKIHAAAMVTVPSIAIILAAAIAPTGIALKLDDERKNAKIKEKHLKIKYEPNWFKVGIILLK